MKRNEMLLLIVTSFFYATVAHAQALAATHVPQSNQSPEIRRAIPVQPAIAEPEIRKAIRAQDSSADNSPAELNRRNWKLYEQGNYEEAISQAKHALDIAKSVKGDCDPDTAQSLNILAECYRAVDDYPKAEPLYKDALAICENLLDPQDPATWGILPLKATYLNNLGALYRETEDFPKAEARLIEAVVILQGLNPPASILAKFEWNLAELYRAMGDYPTAEPLYKDLETIQEEEILDPQTQVKILDPQSLDTATILNSLAEFHRTMGDYAKAKAQYKRLWRFSKTLGRRIPIGR